VWISVGNLYELSIFCWILIGGLPAGGDVEIHFKIKKKKIMLCLPNFAVKAPIQKKCTINYIHYKIHMLHKLIQ